MSELRECPFCGGAPDPVPQESDSRRTDDRKDEYGRDYQRAIWCESCGITGSSRNTEAEAIAAWNRRAPSAAFRAGAAEMRERAAEQVDCGCSWRADALAATNKGERFVACGNDPCGAIEARAIRALPLPAAPEEGG